MSLKVKEYSSKEISKDLGLSSFISNRAPIAKDNQIITEIKNKLQSFAQAESSKIRDKYRAQLEKASNDKQQQFNKFKNLKSKVDSYTLSSFNDLKNQLPPESEKANLEKQSEEANKIRVQFLTHNKLNTRPATPHPDFKWIYLLVPFFCLIIEAYINGEFLGEKTLNPATQKVLAFTIAAVNCLVGFLVGKYLWPKLNIRKHNNLKKTPIVLVILISILIIFSINTLFAHYRQAVVNANQNEKVYKQLVSKGYDLSPDSIKNEYLKITDIKSPDFVNYAIIDGKTLNIWDDYSPIRRADVDDLWSNSTTLFGFAGPFDISQFLNVGDIQSVLLLLIGILFFAIALIDFYLFAGDYPGYSKVLNDCDMPNKQLHNMSKKAQKIRFEFSKKYQSNIKKLNDEYLKNIDNYSQSWNDIEYYLTAFVNEAKSLNEAIQSSMNEFVSDFYNNCSPEIERLDPPLLDLSLSIQSDDQNWDQAFIASKNHFQFLRELWEYDNERNPIRFIDKQDRIRKFQDDTFIFTEAISKQQDLLNQDKHLNNLINFNLKKKRELYLVG